MVAGREYFALDIVRTAGELIMAKQIVIVGATNFDGERANISYNVCDSLKEGTPSKAMLAVIPYNLARAKFADITAAAATSAMACVSRQASLENLINDFASSLIRVLKTDSSGIALRCALDAIGSALHEADNEYDMAEYDKK